MYDYIFLDLDGPILDGKKKHYQCYKDIVDRFGGKALDTDTYWEMKRRKISRDIVLQKSNFQASYAVFVEQWMKNIEKVKYLDLDHLKPQVIETLEACKTISQFVVLVTMRQNRDHLLEQLRKLEILPYFHQVIDCPPQRKQSKYNALKDIPFHKAIFVGDTEEDTKTAKMLGIPSIGITNGIRKRECLDADYYYPELKDIRFNEIA